MLLHFKNVSFDDNLFDDFNYVRDLDLISYTINEGMSCDACVTLNLLFKSPQDARKAFFTILHSKSNEVDLRDIEVEWPSELMNRIIDILVEPEQFQKISI